MRWCREVSVRAVGLGLAVWACGGGGDVLQPALPKATSTAEAFEGGVNISAVRPPPEPEGGCPAGTAWDGKGCVSSAPAAPPPPATQSLAPPQQAPPPAEPTAVAPARPASAAPPSGHKWMVLVPAGTFAMGSNDSEAHADEKPVHQVRVNAFWMDTTEVTVAAYAACVRAGSCAAAKSDEFCNGNKRDRQSHPVNCVSWHEAGAYCAWANKRLPSEEEWEYAARGSDGRKYPWGNEAPGSQLCWNRWESKQGTCEVGAFAAGRSPFGLFDMAGNVWEWTSSDYSEDYSKNRVNDARVKRGGCWDCGDASIVRAAFRGGLAPSIRSFFLGFRCARS
jgi:formylglycine-generating enzyme required for sulfatase activity